MIINKFSKIAISSVIAAAFLFTGCNDNKQEAQTIEKKPAVVKEDTKQIEEVAKQVEKAINEKTEEVKEEAVPTYTKYDSIIPEAFKDAAKIAPDGKQMILVFGTNTDPYSDRLKADVSNSTELQNRLKDEFSSYYLKAHENLRHKQFHEGQLMDVDTKTMIMVYGIEATPTIIFTDVNGKAVIVVPGYIPTKQFLVTMDFMQQGAWKGKDRKNGEVYEALRDFYIKNGIDVISKKAQ